MLLKKLSIPCFLFFLYACQHHKVVKKDIIVVDTSYEMIPDEDNMVLASKSMAYIDSIDKVNSKLIAESGDDVNKASISIKDSSISINANKFRDHRIFGYARPDTSSGKLILFSIFTTDVANNPFQCPLGAYYDDAGLSLHLKYLGPAGNFITVLATDDRQRTTTIYFEQKMFEWEK